MSAHEIRAKLQLQSLKTSSFASLYNISEAVEVFESTTNAVSNIESPETVKDVNLLLQKPVNLLRRRSSNLYINETVKLELRKVGLTAYKRRLCWGKKKKEIKLLENVNANVFGGEVLAIMGPSGAGKSSMLNCATLNHPKGMVMSGAVTINNLELTSKIFRNNCYIVYQKDFLAPRLTCRETLIFAAKNCIDDHHSIEGHVNELIDCLGLTSCQHTTVGDDFRPGLSGGQKRRLSVSLGLVKMPKILFLDEPTSGLDAVSALKTCSHLKLLTLKYNIAAVMTIHQPNTKIWNTFDKLMLLKSGKVAYFGKSTDAEKYFATIGKILPSRTNVADFLLDILEDKDYVNEFDADVEGWKPAFSQKFASGTTSKTDLTDKSSDVSVEEQTLETFSWDLILSPRSKPSLWRETWSTFHREALIIVREPMLYSGRCVVFVLMSIFFSLVYFESRVRIQKQVVTRMWLILWLIGVPCCMACVVIFGHCQDTVNMTRNVRNGLMRPSAYLMARLLQIPIMFVFSLCSVSFSGYLMCNWNVSNYLIVVLLHAMTMYSFELTAEFLALISPHFASGMLGFMCVWFAEFLFSGLLVRDDDIIWPLRAIVYIFPMRYGLQAMVYHEFIGTDISGALECNFGEDEFCHPRNFYCPSETKACYGYSGEQVLESLSFIFPIISAEDKTLMSLCVLASYCLVMKLLYILRVFYVVRQK